MARPTKSGLDYFPHDTDASSDDKLEALQSLYGNDGYAFYFKLCERIYRSENAELNISDSEIIRVLCKKYLLITPEKFNEILSTSLKWGCFDRDAYEQRNVLTSRGIKKRAGVVFEKRREMQERYERMKNNAQSSLHVHEGEIGVSDAETPVSAGFHFTRESKEKNINNKSFNTFPGEKGSFCRVFDAEISEESKKQADEIWSKVLIELRKQVNTANYRAWLSQTKGLGSIDDVFVIGVPNRLVFEYLENNLRSLIEKTIIGVSQIGYKVSFSIENESV